MNNPTIGRATVLEALEARAPKSMHLMEVVAALALPKEQRDRVRDLLDELTALGMAKEMPGNRFRLNQRPPRAPQTAAGAHRRSANQTSANQTEVRGWLTRHPRGFGFVAVEGDEGDVFIPAVHMHNALHGDRVRASARPSVKGREGEILEVLERGIGRVAGTLRQTGKNAWLEGTDARLPDRIEVTGTIPLNTHPGDEVVAVIERWPDFAGDTMLVRVLQSLGQRGSALVEIEKIKIREGVEEEFSDEVLAEAQSFGTRVSQAEIDRREDLRHLDLCTIDPPTARDHDDAVWAERLDDGGFRVVIAIADVSHYVQIDSALDQAALQRCTSIYLPDRVIPMLPHELSSNLASLVPNEDRLCLAVEVTLGPGGAIRAHRFIEGVMRSRARISYDGAARALSLSDAPEPQPDAESRIPLLQILLDVSRALRKRRTSRGSLDFDLPEAVIELDAEGEPIDIRRSRQDPGIRAAYAMIEDLMVLANEVVAADLSRRSIPAIYRVHGQPDEKKIERFATLAESLGYALDPEAHRDPKKLASFLRDVASHERASALNYLLLRAMQQAQYHTKNIGHFALAAKDYLHFTSPIRRYPDLAVHRVVRALIRHKRVDRDKLLARLMTQAAAASRLERRAMTIDREVTDLYRAIFMKERVGEIFDATITGLAEHGIYVAFDTPFVDARIPIDTLGNDWYELDDLGLRLVGSRSGHAFAMGDRLTVRIDSVSIENREILVAVEHSEESAQAQGPQRPRRAPPSRDARGRSGRGQSGRGQSGRGQSGRGQKERDRDQTKREGSGGAKATRADAKGRAKTTARKKTRSKRSRGS